MGKPNLAKLVDQQLRVVLVDGRQLLGKLLSFDKYMNIVLDETIEFRQTKAGQTEQRTLGLVLLRGETIVSTIAEPETSAADVSEVRLAVDVSGP